MKDYKILDPFPEWLHVPVNDWCFTTNRQFYIARNYSYISAAKPRHSINDRTVKVNEIGEAVYADKVEIGLSKLTSTRDIHTVFLAQEPLHLIAPISKKATDAQTLLQQETILAHEYAPYWQDIQQILHNPQAIKV